MLGLKKPYFNSHNLYLFGAFSLCVGLSLSKPLLGLGQILMLAGWLADKSYKQKLKSFFTNPLAIALISFYALTLLGLINTANFDYALNDLRRKLPLFVLPFVLFSKAFSSKELKLFFIVYIGGVLASSFWSVFVKLGGLGIEITDYRDLSRFNSHIRFGLQVCLAIFGASFYYIKTDVFKEKLFWVVTIIWLTLFMFIISLFTGLVVLIGTSTFLVLFYGHKIKAKPLKAILYILPIIAIVFGSMKTNQIYSSFYENNTPLKELVYTPNGNLYFHDTKANNKENGYYTWKNNCFGEMYWEWSKISELPFHKNDHKGQKLKVTLARFLTSKGEYKDSLGVYNLSEQEVIAIENGVANYKQMTMSSIDKRLFDIFWEYDNYKNGNNYSGHSVIMRLEYWKTGLDIFINNLFFGVGSGDIQVAFDKQYELNETPLKPEFRLRAHNQFITTAATFGLIGIVIFCCFLFYPIIKTKSYNNFLYLAFFIILLLSMLTEDTLDTQIGITFFAFFNSLFLLNNNAFQQES